MQAHVTMRRRTVIQLITIGDKRRPTVTGLATYGRWDRRWAHGNMRPEKRLEK